MRYLEIDKWTCTVSHVARVNLYTPVIFQVLIDFFSPPASPFLFPRTVNTSSRTLWKIYRNFYINYNILQNNPPGKAL